VDQNGRGSGRIVDAWNISNFLLYEGARKFMKIKQETKLEMNYFFIYLLDLLAK